MLNFFKKKNEKFDWLVVGLGNPGSKYEGNRHNIGWLVADEFVKKNKVQFRISTIYMTASCSIAGQKVLIAKPTTYMNNSGEAVSKLIKRHGIPPGRLIVIIDEYNFPVGKIHIRDNGGDGGHNGMASILGEIGDFPFFRLRCGISQNFGPGGLIDYVLSDFKTDEIEQRDIMKKNACSAIGHIIRTENSDRALSEINSGKIFITR